MTNKEAIARIIEHKIVHKMNEPRAIYISEALDMAIESIENQKSIIEELEQLKAEIEEYMIISFCEDDDIKNIRTIIEGHISELKGENK